MSARSKRLDKAQMSVLFKVPFFAPGVAKLPVEFLPEEKYRASFGLPDTQTATACTDGSRVTFCEEYFDGLTDPQVSTVLCHEVAHCMLGHVWRAPAGADWEVWNQATDHAVNLMLKEFTEMVTAKNLADPFPFPDPQGAYCADPQFKGLAEEIIYSRLANRPPGGGGGKSGNGKGGKPGPGSMPAFGQIVRPKGAQADPAAQAKSKNDWAATLIQAAQMSKGRGELPAAMDKLIDGIVHPKVPWQEVLRSWLREQASDDWDFMHPDPTFEESGFLMPSLHSEKIGTVVMGRDSSGSISDDIHSQFTAEEQNCLDEMRPAKLVDIHCDTQVHHVAEYTPGDTISHKRHCGGGTDFRPIFEHVAGMAHPPKCLVVLTDLDGTFPDKAPDYPVLWVVPGQVGGSAPFGEVVNA